MALFDTLQDGLLQQVKTTMGYTVLWNPSAGGSYAAIVLYNGPTEKEKLFSAEYDPDKLVMEYQETNLPGLKAAVDADADAEKVQIVVRGNVLNFKVKSVQRKFDGQTFIATLEAITL